MLDFAAPLGNLRKKAWGGDQLHSSAGHVRRSERAQEEMTDAQAMQSLAIHLMFQVHGKEQLRPPAGQRDLGRANPSMVQNQFGLQEVLVSCGPIQNAKTECSQVFPGGRVASFEKDRPFPPLEDERLKDLSHSRIR